MGLLGNVAEVEELRPKLMTKEFVEEFDFLLDSCRWTGSRCLTTLLGSWLTTWPVTGRGVDIITHP